jgi:enoyl-CoA hydratase
MRSETVYQTIRYETPADRVARIVLARPERANAQNNTLLYELDDAFTRASRDDAIHAIILAADGKLFSSGHDLGEGEFDPTLAKVEPVGVWGGFGLPGIEGYWAFEEEAYLGLCMRWRSLPKPVIAAVQGAVIAGGLMLAWVCDLIVASDDASFQDPVVAFGMNGVEYFAHPWEFGARRAKEMLFTGRGFSAAAALRFGMVNRVVPRERLEAETLELAREIAQQPSMGLKLAKQAVNQTQDAQGFQNALRMAMNLQQMGHAHNLSRFGNVGHPDGYGVVRGLARKPPLA